MWGPVHHVHGPWAIALGDHVLHREILHRKAKLVKLRRTPIVSGKTMNKQKILNNIRINKVIIRVKWTRKGWVSYWDDRESWSITYNDGWRIGIGGWANRGQVTGI
jgi:hypothetical protein